MKKIGIVTLNGNTNFGNKLQNYALKEVLTQMGLEVETIWFVKDKKFLLKNMIKSLCFFNKKYVRSSRLRKFSNKYLNVKYYQKKEIASLYDYFVVGSDQVWNWTIYQDFDTYLLKFSPSEKNISYAASFGVDYISEKYQDVYANGLRNFKNISVREEAGKRLVNSIAGLDADVVLDPTMLLSSEDWQKREKKPKKLLTDRYVLTYFLGTPQTEELEEINRVALENKCEVINLLDPNSVYYTATVEEFIYLEKNAFLVCTDSFHSSVMAFLFNTPFVVFSRNDKNVNMNSRLETLLAKFKLENRIFHEKLTREIFEHNYAQGYKILKQEREKSKEFLKTSLFPSGSDRS